MTCKDDHTGCCAEIGDRVAEVCMVVEKPSEETSPVATARVLRDTVMGTSRVFSWG